jgi:hypothetical protein
LTELARQQDSGPPSQLHHVVPEVPPELSAVIMRALHKDPEGRFESAAAMEEALRDSLHGVAPGPPPVQEDSTVVLAQTEATRAMPPQARRPLQPLPPEPPRRRAAAPPPRRRRRRGWGGRIFALLVVAAAIAAIIYGVTELQALSNQPEIRDVSGDLRQSLDDLRDTIRENVR